jgi:methionyl-tRNA formyltransferase
MKIDAGLDTGAMLLKWETEIGAEETALELGDRMAIAGAELLIQTLAKLLNIRPEPQDNEQASYAPVLKKEDGRIDWSMSAREIVNRVRGLLPWPGCYGFLRGQRLHVWKARAAEESLPGGALRVIGKRLYAGSIELLEVQLEGKKRMAAAAFLNGISLEAGESLG